jgi:hypothetical protein
MFPLGDSPREKKLAPNIIDKQRQLWRFNGVTFIYLCFSCEQDFFFFNFGTFEKLQNKLYSHLEKESKSS